MSEAAMVGVATRIAQRALLWIQPDGGQGKARRNAWSSMVVDSRRRAERVEVERSVALVNAGTRDVEPVRQTVTA